jgi:hypothetical protein
MAAPITPFSLRRSHDGARYRPDTAAAQPAASIRILRPERTCLSRVGGAAQRFRCPAGPAALLVAPSVRDRGLPQSPILYGCGDFLNDYEDIRGQ